MSDFFLFAIPWTDSLIALFYYMHCCITSTVFPYKEKDL